MRTIRYIVPAALLAVCCGCVNYSGLERQLEESSAKVEKLNWQIDQIRLRSESANQHIVELEKKLEECRVKLSQTIGINELAAREDLLRYARQKYLGMIRPPENPTEAQIRFFIKEAGFLASESYDGNFNKELAAMAASFGPEYLSDIAQYSSNPEFRRVTEEWLPKTSKEELKALLASYALKGDLFYKAKAAFLLQADESDKDFVLANQNSRREYMLLIKYFGWEEEALELGMSKFYEKMGFYIAGQEVEPLERLIDRLPEFERGRFFRQLWLNDSYRKDASGKWVAANFAGVRAMRHHFPSCFYIAFVLAKYGYRPAFDFLAANVEENLKSKDGRILNHLRSIVSLSPVSSPEEFNDWYGENQDNLIFDSEKKIFRVKQGENTR